MNELLEHRIRMMGSKPVEYEAYPDMYCIGVDCTAPNQQWYLGYYIADSGSVLKILYDGVDVTNNRTAYLKPGKDGFIICPDVGRHYFHLTILDVSNHYIEIGFPYFRFPKPKLNSLAHRISSHKELLKYIDCLDSTPNTIFWNNYFPSNIIQVRVPIGAKAAYVAADKWKDIASKIVEYDFKIKS